MVHRSKLTDVCNRLGKKKRIHIFKHNHTLQNKTVQSFKDKAEDRVCQFYMKKEHPK